MARWLDPDFFSAKLMQQRLYIINKYMSNDKDTQLIWENYLNESQPGKYNDGDGKDERCDHVPCDDQDKEKVNEELDRGDESSDYIAFLKIMADELVRNDMPEDEAMENVLSHPFEETYGEYVRSKRATGPWTAAKAHVQLAQQLGVYHEVDLDSLREWQYNS